MKHSLPVLTVLSLFALLAAPAAEPTSPPGSLPPATALLNLPRLKSGRASPNDPSRLSAARVTVDPLSDQPALGAWGVIKDNVRALRLAPARVWSRPLRGGPRETTFVSFLANASVGTTIDLDGARLILQSGPKPGQAQLVADVPSTTGAVPPPLLVKLESHHGVSLAALPVLTVRLDPQTNTWDLFSFDRLVAADLPLRAGTGPRQFAVLPGATGASLVSLVLCDDHPLFVDANANGIDDTFEKSKRNGTLLAANASVSERRTLAAEWIVAQRQANRPAWRIRRPAPDGTVVSSPATPGS